METQGNLIVPKARLHRRYFPKDFLFGTASSAYQFEGAAHEGGRGPSIWDTFTQRYPGKIKDGSNGNVAVDSYHLYKEDIKIMKKLGVNAYRFSISWPRVLPGGKLNRGVNKEGIKYYNDLIDELLANGIEPNVTIFHWDLPQCLEDEYQGFLSPKIVDDFRDYAELCFWEFGDRVKKWATLNEPTTYAINGYVYGYFAPGRGINEGDPGREPYWVAHYQLLAHAAAVTLYREKFQSTQKGKIGFVLSSMWAEPFNPKDDSHIKAALRALDFGLGWFMEPITTGQYPASMIKNVEDRLPTFTPAQSRQLSGSCDFVGINYYTAKYITNASSPNPECPSYITDGHFSYESTPIGPQNGAAWINVYPIGLYKLLTYVQKTYNDPLIYVTENGFDQPNDLITVTEARMDKWRTEYLQDHLLYLQLALEVGVKVKGYFVWSLLDNFEWSSGYTVRFGIIHIDYNNGLARYPKDSAMWYMNFLHYAPTKRQIEEGEEKDQDSSKKLKM